MEEWSKDAIPEESAELLGGRTPLHIAAARDDDYRVPLTTSLVLCLCKNYKQANAILITFNE